MAVIVRWGPKLGISRGNAPFRWPRSSAIGGPVVTDADLFLDMSKTIQFVVDVHESGDGSPLPGLAEPSSA